MNRTTVRIAKHLLNQWPDAHHWLIRKLIVICDRHAAIAMTRIVRTNSVNLGNKIENRWECGCSIVDNIVDIDTKSTNSVPRARLLLLCISSEFDFDTHSTPPSSLLNLIDSDGYTAGHTSCLFTLDTGMHGYATRLSFRLWMIYLITDIRALHTLNTSPMCNFMWIEPMRQVRIVYAFGRDTLCGIDSWFIDGLASTVGFSTHSRAFHVLQVN